MLLALRGVGCGVLFFLIALLTLAAVDFFVVMEDATRYWLSGGVYLIGLLSFWWFCARPLWRQLEAPELSAMIEKEAPELRAQLLSAVELSGDGEGLDSKALRRQARETVIEKLRGLDTKTLMPKPLKKTCLIAVAVAGTLLAGTGLMAAYEPGRMLLVRALAPMVSRPFMTW